MTHVPAPPKEQSRLLQHGMSKLEDLPYLRVTSLKEFEQCPAKWAARYLTDGMEDQEEKSPAAAIGTAVHAICEDALMALHSPGYKQVDTGPFWATVPEAEHGNVLTYIENLSLLPVKQALVVEERWFHHMRDDAPPVSGQIDFAAEMADGSLMLLDHKTNRSFNDKNWWAAEIQPQMYAWAARKEWPMYSTVRFRIGYPNLGRSVEWETSPDDDGPLLNRFNRIWRAMKECQESNKWPQTLNEWCGYCPLRNGCPEHALAINDFRASMLAKTSNGSILDKLQHARNIERVVKAYCEQLEAEVREMIGGEGRTMESGGFVATLERGSRREIDFQTAWGALSRIINSHNGDQSLSITLWENAHEVFTVKVGGLEALAKRRSEFQQVVDAIEKVPNASVTLKVTDTRRLKK